jgi:oxygen-independent coproporphyrinogen-3 oxidase
MLQSMKMEFLLQKDYLGGETIETIYFGGGTPSVLELNEIQSFIDTVTRLHPVSNNVEITLETNPDDLDSVKVNALRHTDVNRFSIGIQSFFDEDLRWMNRAHTAEEAESVVKRIQDAGFENITLDLIYGFPLLSNEKWKSNISNVIQLNVPHVSAYSMTVEPQTALAAFIRKGKQQAMNDSQSANQFEILMESLQEAGFEHYEISNFAKSGMHSRHNSNYWKGVQYLGIGPSAHSFNGQTRQWNIANNSKYLEALLKRTVPAQIEELTKRDRTNEYIMTSLRTVWGMDLNKIATDFGSDYRWEIERSLDEFLKKEYILVKKDVITLSTKGKLFADHIAAELFIN